MSKLKWDDHAIMGWIGFGRGQKNATVQEAEGYLAYYERDEYTPERFETCHQRLEAAGLIRARGSERKAHGQSPGAMERMLDQEKPRSGILEPSERS